jgi:hypothetical protein
MSVRQKFDAYFFLRLGLLVDGVNLTGLFPTKFDHRVHPLHLVFVPINSASISMSLVTLAFRLHF